VRRILVLIAAVTTAVITTAGSSFACGSLVAPNGAVDLERTTTLAAYHDGLEHYITTFEFKGTQASFGSIVPLPGRPTKVERGGDWTLQRLEREVKPVLASDTLEAAPSASGKRVEVIQQTRIDSLDVTILKGGGRAVARWARANGFDLTRDTPASLEFYSRRSPYFMAARFDATSAVQQGLTGGDGIPVHLTIPVDEPWVPLRILSTAKPKDERINADVFLLTDRKPALLHGRGFDVRRSGAASSSLLRDLRADQGMQWVPRRMWLTFAAVDARASDLRYDLAVNTHGGAPDFTATGMTDLFTSQLEIG
jgi:hypothetical protein